MTDLRQAAQQALEALDSGNPYHQQLAAKVLRTALEQQAEPTCPDCKAAVLYECVACSSNNYPPKQQAEPVQEPYESPYNPNPVEYQYHYPDGSWSCSNGEVINGMHPDRARSLYALKDNT